MVSDEPIGTANLERLQQVAASRYRVGRWMPRHAIRRIKPVGELTQPEAPALSARWPLHAKLRRSMEAAALASRPSEITDYLTISDSRNQVGI